ncbi:MAG: 3-isopropylmalate dehydratase small subunit [Steroidobacteraceae bacterium]|nr:3-isopropylmalate dehydratase small subunit [Steroidobacteraceae bacterium]
MSGAAPAPRGRAWVFGDRVDTDQLAPGYAMRKPLEELAKHCLEAVRPEFARDVARGDIVVGGEGFGIGSSREQAAQALRFLGVSVVLAKSAARIFYRNAFNIGLPVMIVPEAGQIADGAQLEVDLAAGLVRDTTSGREYRGEPVPAFLLEIVADGGLIPNLHKRLHGKPAA